MFMPNTAAVAYGDNAEVSFHRLGGVEYMAAALRYRACSELLTIIFVKSVVEIMLFRSLSTFNLYYTGVTRRYRVFVAFSPMQQ